MPVSSDPRVLVDWRTSDDAGVYKLDERRAIVQTIDFFTPIVDDPYAYGRIAAANALSDVYAMGGRPLTALAIAGFPKDVDTAILTQIFRGGLAALTEAGVALLGGHTVQDQEIKFGYAITGEVDPDAVWTNAGARVGDRLILTKPIGTGVIGTAIKAGRAPEHVAGAALESMIQLNAAASSAIRDARAVVHACTDITGFGLIGHSTEIARASGCTLVIDTRAVPLLPGVLDLVAQHTPGGGRTNRQYFEGSTSATDDVKADPSRLQLLYDPQTSGGLLFAIGAESAAAALNALGAAGARGWPIGWVDTRSTVAVSLR
jgi:selenide, water dikinase